MTMRFFFSGPRILGIRPGISFGANELLRLATKPKQNTPGEPMTGSFLYVIRGDHNLVKIGVSTNPNARLAQLRTASAFPIDFSYICAGEWFDVQPEMAVAAIAGAAHKLGQPILAVTAEVANQILQVAASTPTTPTADRGKYLFDGLPWFLRLPLQMVGGAICGVVIFAALALLYLIAASPR